MKFVKKKKDSKIIVEVCTFSFHSSNENILVNVPKHKRIYRLTSTNIIGDRTGRVSRARARPNISLED